MHGSHLVRSNLVRRQTSTCRWPVSCRPACSSAPPGRAAVAREHAVHLRLALGPAPGARHAAGPRPRAARRARSAAARSALTRDARPRSALTRDARRRGAACAPVAGHSGPRRLFRPPRSRRRRPSRRRSTRRPRPCRRRRRRGWPFSCRTRPAPVRARRTPTRFVAYDDLFPGPAPGIPWTAALGPALKSRARGRSPGSKWRAARALRASVPTFSMPFRGEVKKNE